MPLNFELFAAPVGWGVVITSVMFGRLPGAWLDRSLAIQLEVIALRNSTFSGFVFAWLRERNGSLLMPNVVHGLEDVLIFISGMP